MSNHRNERLQGLLRWREWLAVCLSVADAVHHELEEVETNEAVWSVQFRGGTRARLEISEQALLLTEEGFKGTTDRLVEDRLVELLRDGRHVRILADGELRITNH